MCFPLQDATSEGAQMDDRLWYWLSMCQNIMSQAVLGLIEPSQDAIMQARLKRMSIRHAVASAKFGNFWCVVACSSLPANVVTLTRQNIMAVAMESCLSRAYAASGRTS